jgi:hypothetical protein
MTSIDLTAQPLTTRLRWQLSDSLVFAKRNIAHVRQAPRS